MTTFNVFFFLKKVIFICVKFSFLLGEFFSYQEGSLNLEAPVFMRNPSIELAMQQAVKENVMIVHFGTG